MQFHEDKMKIPLNECDDCKKLLTENKSQIPFYTSLREYSGSSNPEKLVYVSSQFAQYIYMTALIYLSMDFISTVP